MTRYICDTARACDGQANKVKLLWPMWNMWEVLIFFFSTLEPAMDECQDPGQHDTSQTTLDDTSWTTSGGLIKLRPGSSKYSDVFLQVTKS